MLDRATADLWPLHLQQKHCLHIFNFIKSLRYHQLLTVTLLSCGCQWFSRFFLSDHRQRVKVERKTWTVSDWAFFFPFIKLIRALLSVTVKFISTEKWHLCKTALFFNTATSTNNNNDEKSRIPRMQYDDRKTKQWGQTEVRQKLKLK